LTLSALDFNTAVEIIALLEADYDSRGWGHSAKAAAEIMGEVIGYLSTKLFVIIGT